MHGTGEIKMGTRCYNCKGIMAEYEDKYCRVCKDKIIDGELIKED